MEEWLEVSVKHCRTYGVYESLISFLKVLLTKEELKYDVIDVKHTQMLLLIWSFYTKEQWM